MFKCKSCELEFRDVVQCTACQGHFDFGCAGITETGYRRLGENRKSVWKCVACKSNRSASPLQLPTKSTTPLSPTPTDLDTVLAELRCLSLQVAVLPRLEESVKNIKSKLSELKTIKTEISDIKSTIEFVDHKIGALSDKISAMERDIQSLQKTKTDVELLQQRLHSLESIIRVGEQRSRMNNLEIKGVPIANSENLFDIVAKIGSSINCGIPKEQINYITRVPMRGDKNNKTIIVAVHSRYIKDDFIAAAKRCTLIPTDVGMQGSHRIFVNDHLTADSKMLLNKTKTLAKERGFSFVWVRGCKIFVRKNPASPVITINSESDLKKL